MQTSQKHQSSASVQGLYHQPVQKLDHPYYFSNFHAPENNTCPNISQGSSISFQSCDNQFFTLESTPPIADLLVCESSSAGSVISKRIPFSPQGSQSCSSDPNNFFDNAYGSPVSGCSVNDDDSEFKHKLREIELSLLGPESDIVDSCYCSFKSGTHQASSDANWKWNQMVDVVQRLNLKEVLICCAQAVDVGDLSAAMFLIDVLEQMVSVSGDPMQRLGAYMLEGLRARLERSGSLIYRTLKCEEPTSSELMSYMSVLYHICPYWKFAYLSANVVIKEAMENEPRIHIIDFQIAQGSQWVLLIQDIARRPGGPPFIQITGVDDSQSARARGGGLELVGNNLAKIASSCGVPFEFHAAAMSGFEVQRENLQVQPGEAVAVNFPYVLHHMPDESVSTENHRDRLLRLVKSLSPKVVTLVEQESNTNTSPFISRVAETLDYYTAMFQSIDVARPRDDKQRVKAEQNCVARDIVNMIACEKAERVERHELFGKWRMRLMMAGFNPCPLSYSVTVTIRKLLSEYNENYRVEVKDGALYLYWMRRAMATSSAWR